MRLKPPFFAVLQIFLLAEGCGCLAEARERFTFDCFLVIRQVRVEWCCCSLVRSSFRRRLLSRTSTGGTSTIFSVSWLIKLLLQSVGSPAHTRALALDVGVMRPRTVPPHQLRQQRWNSRRAPRGAMVACACHGKSHPRYFQLQRPTCSSVGEEDT